MAKQIARKNIKRYGVPYKGSKNLIARDIVEALPPAGTFVDLFAGGCAVTHAALLSGKYRRIICNDVFPLAARLFRLATEGGLRNETRWISRETFLAECGRDPYITYAWSFGNKGDCYLYSRRIEPYKRALHYAVLFDDWGPYAALMPETLEAAQTRLAGITDTADRRVLISRAITEWLRVNGTAALLTSHPLYSAVTVKGSKNSRQDLQRLERLERLESLERLQSLERLECLQSLENLERLQSLQSLGKLTRLQSLQSLQNLERLQSLERLERLQSLESLESFGRITSLITYSEKDYREVEIPPDAVVYCDPPYAGVTGYGVEFDNDAFCRYVEALGQRGVLVAVSEYSMPFPRFVPVWRKKKKITICSGASKEKTEQLFVPNGVLPLYKKMMGKNYTPPSDGVQTLF